MKTRGKKNTKKMIRIRKNSKMIPPLKALYHMLAFKHCSMWKDGLPAGIHLWIK
jgi:hypothetical protein